jgi:hypothetical protein
MKIENLKFEIESQLVRLTTTQGGRKACAKKKSESPHVDSYERRKGLRKIPCGPRTDGPMRFEETLHSIVSQPGKIRIACRRLQRWLEFFGKH